MLLYFASLIKAQCVLEQSRALTLLQLILRRSISLKCKFSETISRSGNLAIHLRALGEVCTLVAASLGHIRAHLGCVAAPSLVLLFPLQGSPSAVHRWALWSAWPGPQMIEGPKPWVHFHFPAGRS